ncbi:MAG: hypothetical protein J3Q66DRAFT_395723 [Benniella sp.]|nr:MAG: hypothetical protein J3Q66DRAFT_395723 [Benniella sp.]
MSPHPKYPAWKASDSIAVHRFFKEIPAAVWSFVEFVERAEIRPSDESEDAWNKSVRKQWKTGLKAIRDHEWTPESVKAFCRELLHPKKNEKEVATLTLGMDGLNIDTPRKPVSRTQSPERVRRNKPEWSSNRRRELLERVNAWSFTREHAADLDPVVNNFRFAFNRELLFDLLQEMSSKMTSSRHDDPAVCERQYPFVRHGSNGGFTGTPTTLMTEKKPRDKEGIITDEDFDLQHDGILFHLPSRLEVLVIEAKRHHDHKEQKVDVRRLEVALSTMLAFMVIGREGVESRLRSFGVRCSGFDVALFEARYQGDVILMYEVYPLSN